MNYDQFYRRKYRKRKYTPLERRNLRKIVWFAIGMVFVGMLVGGLAIIIYMASHGTL